MPKPIQKKTKKSAKNLKQDNWQALKQDIEVEADDNSELLTFSSIIKGEFKVPGKGQLANYIVPETELKINEKNMDLTAKLPGTTMANTALSLTQDSVAIHSKNDRSAYYTDIKLPSKIVPQSAVAKFRNGTLYLNFQKLDPEQEPWDGLTQLEELQNELQDTRSKLVQFQQQYHVIQLEYQDILVKGKKEVETKIDAFKVSVLDKILKNIDAFELAVQSASKATTKQNSNDQILVGINMILNDLRNLIKEEGVTEIVSDGQVLDPHQHEVMNCEETDKYSENTILKTYQKGYRYKDRVLRPAKVLVAIAPKKKSKKK